jgi:hypothetical protein
MQSNWSKLLEGFGNEFVNRIKNSPNLDEGGFFNDISNIVSGNDWKKQQTDVFDQMKAYQEQTDMAKQQMSDLQNQERIQRQKIQEKQIRSLRSNYRGGAAGGGAGFLNNQGNANSPTNGIGASPGIPSKLGTV